MVFSVVSFSFHGDMVFSVVSFSFHGDVVFSVVSFSNPLSCGRCKLDKRSRGKSLVTIATSAAPVQQSDQCIEGRKPTGTEQCGGFLISQTRGEGGVNPLFVHLFPNIAGLILIE